MDRINGTLTPVGGLTGSLNANSALSGTLEAVAQVTGALSGTGGLQAYLSGTSMMTGAITIPPAIGGHVYDGPYEWTPTQETQTINTSRLLLEEDIIINPIPSNYGLITWNGSTLMVS